MPQTIKALFENREDADLAVRALKSANILVMDVAITRTDINFFYAEAIERDARMGACAGAALGSIGGLLASLGVFEASGLDLLAAGWLAVTAAGAGSGAIAGAAIGGTLAGLTKPRVPRSRAGSRLHDRGHGSILVWAQVPDGKQAEAKAALAQADPLISARRAGRAKSR